MNKQPNIKAAFMLVLFLIVSFFGAEGTLLCFGKNGHVAIELIDACNGVGTESQLAGTKNDACGPCQDVQFVSTAALTNNSSIYIQTFPVVSGSTAVSSSYPAEYFSNRLVPPVSLYHKTLASLNSVILLI